MGAPGASGIGGCNPEIEVRRGAISRNCVNLDRRRAGLVGFKEGDHGFMAEGGGDEMIAPTGKCGVERGARVKHRG